MCVFVPYKLFGIFDKADEDNDAGANQAREEHHLENAHSENGEGHVHILARVAIDCAS